MGARSHLSPEILTLHVWWTAHNTEAVIFRLPETYRYQYNRQPHFCINRNEVVDSTGDLVLLAVIRTQHFTTFLIVHGSSTAGNLIKGNHFLQGNMAKIR